MPDELAECDECLLLAQFVATLQERAHRARRTDQFLMQSAARQEIRQTHCKLNAEVTVEAFSLLA